MSEPPNKPRDPASAIEGVGAAKAPKAVDGPAELEGAQQIEASGQSAAVASPADIALAEALSTGAVDQAGAQAALIDEVVRAQLPPEASAELIEQVREEVQGLLAEDPTMAALLDPKR